MEVLTKRHDQDSAQGDHLQWRIAEEIGYTVKKKKSLCSIYSTNCIKKICAPHNAMGVEQDLSDLRHYYHIQ